MESVGSLFEKDHLGQLIVTIFLIIYLIMGFHLPSPLAKFVDSLLGKILILGFVTYIFNRVNPILSLLTILVAFDMIRKSYISTGNFGLNNFVPSEIMKSNQLSAFNQFPYTLEQEVIANRAPIYNGGPLGKAPYRPFMEDLHDASRVTKSN